MIIGISGHIGAGKDELAKMLMGLDNQFIVKKFAGKLKDIVCMLIGCTREQLEDIDFKNSELGPEWDAWRCEGVVTGVQYVTLEKPNAQPQNIRNLREEGLTPRKMLQLLGTEGGRQVVHPNIWVNALFADYSKGFEKVIDDPDPHLYCGLPITSVTVKTTPSKWLISDCRFPNEAKAIKDRGGILIRVNRDSDNPSSHESETALDSYDDWSEVIDNNGSLLDLQMQAQKIYHKYIANA